MNYNNRQRFDPYRICTGCQYLNRIHSKILVNLLKQPPKLFQPQLMMPETVVLQSSEVRKTKEIVHFTFIAGCVGRC